MLFNSFSFLLGFLPLILCVLFWLARYRPSWAPAWLALASIGFYGGWSLAYIPLLLASIAFNFMAGGQISRLATRGQDRACRRLLIASITANLLLLGYYKYTGFLISSWDMATGMALPVPRIELPLGISFFTFTQIAYLVDASRRLTTEYDVVRYALFVTYYPHLIAGPILHHKEMMRQFVHQRAFRFRPLDLSAGIALFIIGLGKKVLLADQVAPIADAVFGAGGNVTLTQPEAWIGILAYTLQIYFDFSGYSDMAVALARMMGVRIPLNFNSPYKSGSIIEFWRRWHMTLSRFLRDYLYVPLGGNRRGPLRRHANLMATMLLGGLWHGAGWTFVIWGGLHGAYLIVNHGWRSAFGPSVSWWGRLLSWLLTFLAVMLAWVFFRADSVATAWRIISAAAGWNGMAMPHFVADVLGLSATSSFHNVLFDPWSSMAKLVLLLAVALFLPNSQEMLARYRPALERVTAAPAWLQWRPSLIWGMSLGLLLAICVTLLGGNSPFLYFRF